MGAARQALTPFDAALASLASPLSAITADTTEAPSASKVLLADNSASPNTRKAMRDNPDLDGTNAYGGAVTPAAAPQPLGNDPTRRVDQKTYDAMKKQQNEEAMRKYLEMKARRK